MDPQYEPNNTNISIYRSYIIDGYTEIFFLFSMLVLLLLLGLLVVLIGGCRIGRWSKAACVSCNLSGSLRENEFMIHFVGGIRIFNVRFQSMKTWQHGPFWIARMKKLDMNLESRVEPRWRDLKRDSLNLRKVLRIVNFVLQVAKFSKALKIGLFGCRQDG
ncbi:hypothetical protein VN97_g6031 [Penicillium thymicola]|uniref:Uncharacterized protein n=1 Tax=Penicillium thymicola TaxID=293382 RepID=A0AAI9THT4_PENTH|nr:hypothetical protein VN97_g6031 [Penicillium thymicola]